MSSERGRARERRVWWREGEEGERECCGGMLGEGEGSEECSGGKVGGRGRGECSGGKVGEGKEQIV